MTIVTFGEIMLRLSPPQRQLLLQTPALETWIAGAEANVATQLAHLGHAVRMASAVPDNDLGDAAVRTLRSYGIDVRTIMRFPGRMGLYFVTPGAGSRASDVIYDRVQSSFACAPTDCWDWDSILTSASRLHLSGITPALSENAALAAQQALDAAERRAVPISFDCNYRSRLWAEAGRDPAASLIPLVERAEVMFGNHHDISLLLGAQFSGEGPERRREAALAAFARFPRLAVIASTARRAETADCNYLAARIDTRAAYAQTEEFTIAGIVDRVGTGDAFCAGVLHGLARGLPIEDVANTGLALATLKHSLPGDASLFSESDLSDFIGGQRDVRR